MLCNNCTGYESYGKRETLKGNPNVCIFTLDIDTIRKIFLPQLQSKQNPIIHRTSRSTRLEFIVRRLPRLINQAWIIHVQISISLQARLINMCVCVCVCAPEITNFNTDETETNAGPEAIAHLQMSMLSKIQTGWEIHLFHIPSPFHFLLILETL